MRKILATILSICACTAFALPKTGNFHAFAEEATAQFSVPKNVSMPINKIKNLTSEKLVNMLQQGTADIAEFDKFDLWQFIHRNDWKKILPEFPLCKGKVFRGQLF